MLPNVQTNNNAPDDIEVFTLSPSKRAAICAIMDLTDKECAEIEKAMDFAFGRKYEN